MRYILPILILLPMLLAGQENEDVGRASIQVNISANVVDFIEMITLADVDVGMVQPSQEQVNLDPRLDPGAGIIMLSGREGAGIRITYTQQVVMVNTMNNSTLDMTYNLAGNPENDQSSAELFLNNPMQVTLSDQGTYYIYIGCLFSLDQVSPGQYDGDFVLEVEYM